MGLHPKHVLQSRQTSQPLGIVISMSNSFKESALPAPDLSSCEREPIHVPGAIEPNGGILVISEPDLAILQSSTNIHSMLGAAPEALLRMHLEEVFSKDDVRRLISGSRDDGKRCYVNGVRGIFSDTLPCGPRPLLDALVHRHQGLLILELEPSSPASMAAGPDIYASLTDATAELEGSLSLADLCQRVATRIRHITAFDRVMVYQFLKDDTGCVIAEGRREDLVPYLGLRYPASDIPAQARRLYLTNTLRLKADVNARTSVLVPAVNPVTGTPLDMTFCVLRAMSPVHVEYLRNMGVAASMSVSIVKDGRLWGLIACHHCEAKLVPHPTRITCEVLARVFSSHIAAAEQKDERARGVALQDLAGRVEAKLRADKDVAATLGEMAEDISTGMGASGCAFSIRGKIVLAGITPDRAQVDALLVWLGVNQRDHVFITERLATLYPNVFDGLASGLLSVRIALGGTDFVVWFRPPIVKVVNWGGNPEKPIEETEAGQRISPRRSFEKWKQTVRDNSEPWADMERAFASSLRPLIAETLFLQMNEDIVRLNVELARSNVELESFSYTASHDLQEPVRTIRAYSQLLARRADSELTQESRELLTTIETSAARMGSLISALLSYSQLGGKDRREGKLVPLGDVLRWVLTNLDEQIRESAAVITHDDLPMVFSDLDHMVQLLQNLIGNAIKYRRPDVPLRVHVSSHGNSDAALLSVRDNGQGFEPKNAEVIFAAFKRLHGREIPGNGVGLATCRRVVELHNGRIWAESEGKDRGATFWFTLPRSNAESKGKSRS